MLVRLALAAEELSRFKFYLLLTSWVLGQHDVLRHIVPSVDDRAHDGVGADEDGALDVADVGAGVVGDAAADIAVDHNDSGVTTSLIPITNTIIHSVINTTIPNANGAILIRTNTIIRIIINLTPITQDVAPSGPHAP